MSRARLFYEEVALHHFVTCCPSLFESENFPVEGIIALDEVGRGCLAGPVVAGASLWVRESSLAPRFEAPARNVKKWLPLVGDSKALSYDERAECFEKMALDFCHLKTFDIESDYRNNEKQELVDGYFERIALESLGSISRLAKTIKQADKPRLVCVALEVGAASNFEIDEINIWNAVQLAMGRAMTRLHESILRYELRAEEFGIVVDGKLKVKVPPAFVRCRQLTAIGADDKFLSVGAASVAAKVTRDRYMEKQGILYPDFGFEKHKGYATRHHWTALTKLNPTPLHRSSFLRNLQGREFNGQDLLPDEL